MQEIHIVVSDIAGKQIFNKTIQTYLGKNNMILDLSEHLFQQGIYNVTISSNDVKNHYQVVKY